MGLYAPLRTSFFTGLKFHLTDSCYRSPKKWGCTRLSERRQNRAWPEISPRIGFQGNFKTPPGLRYANPLPIIIGAFQCPGRLAQWLERLVHTEEAGGSNPPSPTIGRLSGKPEVQPRWRNRKTRCVQGAVSLRMCGFKSHPRHQPPIMARRQDPPTVSNRQSLIKRL